LSTGIVRGTPEFRRTVLAMSSAGFATFTLMYCVQPLLPVFTQEFGIGAATASLAVSLTTGCLAVAMLVASVVSDRLGRRPIMIASMLLAGVFTLLSAFATSWPAMLAMRAAVGIAFGGLPALAMAYLGEEMDARSLGYAMGLYVGGTGVGGMSGRLITSVLTDVVSWRFAIGAVGVIGILAAAFVWRMLPPSRRFVPVTEGTMRSRVSSFAAHLRDTTMLRLFGAGFAALGTVVAVYNYVGFRLMAPPYNASQTAIGLLFLLYLLGVWSSGWTGSLVQRVGRPVVLRASMGAMMLGAVITLAGALPVMVLGVALVTMGFFGVQSVGSTWVAARAHRGRAQGTSLYLLFYYMGSAIAGWAAGIFFGRVGWAGVVAFVVALVGMALAASWTLDDGEIGPSTPPS
jgi:YNFM family putative membrane transporter